jgi:plasmid stabilization system protein ParE
MRVVYSSRALVELDEILAFVAKFSPASAARVESRIRHVVEWIGNHPEAAQEMMGRPGVRRMPLIRYPYLIYYMVGADEVTILRIRHAARRPLQQDDL